MPGASNWGDWDPGAAAGQPEQPCYRRDPCHAPWISIATNLRRGQEEAVGAGRVSAECVCPLARVAGTYVHRCRYTRCTCVLMCTRTGNGGSAQLPAAPSGRELLGGRIRPR